MRHGATIALVSMLCLATFGAPSLAGDPWSLPDESRGTRVAPLFLLSRADVREDLKIAPDQVLEIDQAILDLFEKAKALKGKDRPGRHRGPQGGRCGGESLARKAPDSRPGRPPLAGGSPLGRPRRDGDAPDRQRSPGPL